jgi:hypothetical protein
MAIDDRDILLASWRYDSLPQARFRETFGQIWYDNVAALWRMFTHSTTGGSQTIIQYQSANWYGPWSGRATALGLGASGAWDDAETGVPTVWCEPGETRPWRMLYRGMKGTTKQIGLERKRTVNVCTWVWCGWSMGRRVH